jgi:hypothetical protein
MANQFLNKTNNVTRFTISFGFVLDEANTAAINNLYTAMNASAFSLPLGYTIVAWKYFANNITSPTNTNNSTGNATTTPTPTPTNGGRQNLVVGTTSGATLGIAVGVGFAIALLIGIVVVIVIIVVRRRQVTSEVKRGATEPKDPGQTKANEPTSTSPSSWEADAHAPEAPRGNLQSVDAPIEGELINLQLSQISRIPPTTAPERQTSPLHRYFSPRNVPESGEHA